MNNSNPIISIDALKIQADILQKALKSSDNVADAIQRMRCLPDFQNLSDSDILSKTKRKHVLNVIALENQFDTWSDLVKYCEGQLSNTFVDAYAGGFLNHWFPNYDEAKAYQEQKGGYLMPYKSQYFICDLEYISWLGFDKSDLADWEAMGNDWVKPTSYKAWIRLNKKWRELQSKKANVQKGEK